MDESLKRHYVDTFLADKKDRAVESFKKGNRLAAAYLASILGMWTNACKRPNVNPFQEDEYDIWLYKWFGNGYEDFSQALGISAKIRKQQLDMEKAWADEQEAAEKKPIGLRKPYSPTQTKAEKKGFWDIKLW